jgi:hypothetical protein
MKNHILLSAYSLMIAIGVVSCAGDKKPAPNEAPTALSETSSSTVATTSTAHSTEQKLYDLSSAFIDKIEAAIAEQDDNKAIAMLNHIEKDMEPRTNALRPEIESWVKSLSEPERKAFGERLFTQPSTVKAYKMMGDPKLNERLQKNAMFREAFEKANAGTANIWQGKGTQIEDSEE